ncbi:hypothetical protein GCM10022415_04560 [Knoellia locipacati]|uniref:Glycosyl transferase family 1 domain-containing protein n=1 Tax=Knoellia locipacati TaxID=882824 RepID=A0A512SWT9_9MICO|nr:glycosyltransferase family 4 protein [Knoellia locipacati]GEQ12407.1 hypothetical protein KLO01_04540 [Knoellia locipacati]
MINNPLLAIGPANYAGQAHQWARAVHLYSSIDAESFEYVGGNPGFNFSADNQIPGTRSNPWVRRRAADSLLKRFTHVAVDGFQRVYSMPRVGSLLRDYRRVAGNGRELILISHGSDTRDPDAHLSRVPYSYFKYADGEFVDQARQRVRQNRRVRDALGAPLLVSTPDLLIDNPEAIWLPLCVDVDRFSAGAVAFSSAKPKVLHMPTRRNPPIKGSQFIEPALEQLEREGAITWIRGRHVSHAEMPALLQEADIVVDQVLTDSFGVSAVEAMASGRLTIANVGAATRRVIGRELPIVDLDPGTFLQGFREVLSDRSHLQRLASAGPEYVASVHGGQRSAAVLVEAMGRTADMEKHA